MVKSLLEGFIVGLLLSTILHVYLRSVIPPLYQLWFLLLIIPVCAVAFYQWHLIRIRGQLRIYLEQVARKQQLPLCLNCGYNLQGLPGPLCPECGAGIRPRNEDAPSI